MWKDLTMQQRADVISMAIKAGMRDMKSIRSFYDETLGSRRFDDGGGIKKYVGDLEDIGYDADNMKFYEKATGKELGDSAILDEVIVNSRNRANDYLTEANDNTSVYNVPHREYNQHLKDRAEQGARQEAIWREEHPNLSAWGEAAASIPFAVASVPLIAGGAEALAGTSVGQAVSSGLLSLSNMAKASPVAGLWPYVNAGMQSAIASHGISETMNGNLTPETVLELSPLAPGAVRVPGIINNLRPQNIRNHLYVAKAPVGYYGTGDALERWFRGIMSGKPADIDNPWWFNSNMAKQLEDYAYVPEIVQGAEREQYLQQFGEHALRARADAWRMHNLIPQKFNTFTPNPRHPGSYTDIEGIKRLKYIPPQVEGKNQIDFINSVGGNIGVPEITSLGSDMSRGVEANRFGVTTTQDWFDLHPFSRAEDRLIPRFVRPFFDKYIQKPGSYISKYIKYKADGLKYNTKEIEDWIAKNKDDEYAMEMFDPDMFPTTGLNRKIGDILSSISKGVGKATRTPRRFKFLEPIDDKLAHLEVGNITGGKPFLAQYDIPFTAKTTWTHKGEGTSYYLPGFISDNILPPEVVAWKKNWPTDWSILKSPNININTNISDFLKKSKTGKK